jgi:hypothetical protein
MDSLETIAPEDLATAHGGVKMQLTQYGYAGDPYSDSYTRKGKGAYRNLSSNSIAFTTAGLHALGLSRRDVMQHHRWVQLRTPGGGVLLRQIDDWAPQGNKRADLYMPRGFDHKLPDNVDVQLIPRAIPVHR